MKGLESLGTVAKTPSDVARDAAVVLGGRVVEHKVSTEKYAELLDMLGITGNQLEEEQTVEHSTQSSYRHYRNWAG